MVALHQLRFAWLAAAIAVRAALPASAFAPLSPFGAMGTSTNRSSSHTAAAAAAVRDVPTATGSALEAAANDDAAAAAASTSTSTLSSRDEAVCSFLRELAASNLPFRIVVVGTGAILESTHVLGPVVKLGQSPKSGQHILTFATEDQSFEFHVLPALVDSVALVSRPSPTSSSTPGSTMRLLRLMNADGGSICSLILADDDSEASGEWYDGMAAKYGSEVRF